MIYDNEKKYLHLQYDFSNSFIRSHGYIIAAFYMAIRFCDIKKSMMWCLKYLQNNCNKGNHINYNLRIVCDAINNICDGSPAKFYKSLQNENNNQKKIERDYSLSIFFL